MSVATKVIQGIPKSAKGFWGKVPLTCHFSTVFWLYWEAYGKTPSESAIIDLNFDPGLTNVMTQMVKDHGAQVKSGGLFGKSPTFAAGTVLVFYYEDSARHSCIAIKDGEIGGCNQVDWFKTAGAVNTYTTHKVKDLDWRFSFGKGSEIKGGHNWCNLYQISEKNAIASIKKAFGDG